MKYIIIIVVIIILISTFKKWWENNWRSYYGEGIRRFRAKDYYKANNQFGKAYSKNQDKWEISYYWGLSSKIISDNMDSREAIGMKEFAISCFIDALELNPKYLKSNNMIEIILCDEEDAKNQKKLIKHLREKLATASDRVKNQFNYIDEIEDSIIDSENVRIKENENNPLKSIANSMKTFVENTEKRTGKKPTFRDFLQAIGEDSNIENYQSYLTLLGNAWAVAGLGKSNVKEIYEEYLSDEKNDNF